MKITNQTIFSNQNTDLKVLVISDLHVFKKRDIHDLEKITEVLKMNEYDAIYVLGDILDGTDVLYKNTYVAEKCMEFISSLGEMAPTYIVYGNHDVAYCQNRQSVYDFDFSKSYFLDKMNSYKNVYVLDNEVKMVKDGYTVSGYNPPCNYMERMNEILLEDVEHYAFLKNLSKENMNTLLCHDPNVIQYLNQNGFLSHIDVAAAGHTHSGVTQLRIFPLQAILNLVGQPNRGCITPNHSMAFRDTKYLRGRIPLRDGPVLLVNPSFKTFSACTGGLQYLDSLFYKGASEIHYVAKEKILKR